MAALCFIFPFIALARSWRPSMISCVASTQLYRSKSELTAGSRAKRPSCVESAPQPLGNDVDQLLGFGLNNAVGNPAPHILAPPPFVDKKP